MEEEPLCPFCGSMNDCEHVLLIVDKTFRSAEAGILMNALNERWSALRETGGDDFDEREVFDRLLEEASTLSDAVTENDVEGGPGKSSTYLIYYVRSSPDIRKLLPRFSAGRG